MSNSNPGRPAVMVLDTAGTTVAASEIRIQAFSWYTGTATSSVELLAGVGTAGNTIFVGTNAGSSMVTLTLLEPLRVNGAYLKTLGALGNLVVYLAPSDRPYTS